MRCLVAHSWRIDCISCRRTPPEPTSLGGVFDTVSATLPAGSETALLLPRGLFESSDTTYSSSDSTYDSGGDFSGAGASSEW